MGYIYPNQAEVDEAVAAVNMDEAIENLSDWQKSDKEVAVLHPDQNGMFPLLAVHAMADIAEAYNLPLKSESMSLHVVRPQSREELEKAVRSHVYTSLIKKTDDAKTAE